MSKSTKDLPLKSKPLEAASKEPVRSKTFDLVSNVGNSAAGEVCSPENPYTTMSPTAPAPVCEGPSGHASDIPGGVGLEWKPSKPAAKAAEIAPLSKPQTPSTQSTEPKPSNASSAKTEIASTANTIAVATPSASEGPMDDPQVVAKLRATAGAEQSTDVNNVQGALFETAMNEVILNRIGAEDVKDLLPPGVPVDSMKYVDKHPNELVEGEWTYVPGGNIQIRTLGQNAKGESTPKTKPFTDGAVFAKWGTLRIKIVEGKSGERRKADLHLGGRDDDSQKTSWPEEQKKVREEERLGLHDYNQKNPKVGSKPLAKARPKAKSGKFTETELGGQIRADREALEGGTLLVEGQPVKVDVSPAAEGESTKVGFLAMTPQDVDISKGVETLESQGLEVTPLSVPVSAATVRKIAQEQVAKTLAAQPGKQAPAPAEKTEAVSSEAAPVEAKNVKAEAPAETSAAPKAAPAKEAPAPAAKTEAVSSEAPPVEAKTVKVETPAATSATPKAAPVKETPAPAAKTEAVTSEAAPVADETVKVETPVESSSAPEAAKESIPGPPIEPGGVRPDQELSTARQNELNNVAGQQGELNNAGVMVGLELQNQINAALNEIEREKIDKEYTERWKSEVDRLHKEGEWVVVVATAEVSPYDFFGDISGYTDPRTLPTYVEGSMYILHGKTKEAAYNPPKEQIPPPRHDTPSRSGRRLVTGRFFDVPPDKVLIPPTLLSNDGIYRSEDPSRILVLSFSESSVKALNVKSNTPLQVTDIAWGEGLSFSATFLYPQGFAIRSSFKFLKNGVLSETYVATGPRDYSRAGTIIWRNSLLP